MIVAVSGWRSWEDHLFVIFHLRRYLTVYGPDLHLRVGDAAGVDQIVREWITYQQNVKRIRISHCVYYADWNRYGRPAAGPLRNSQMLRGESRLERFPNVRADELLAFPQPGVRMRSPGSGTTGCMMEAHLLGITVTIPGYTAG